MIIDNYELYKRIYDEISRKEALEKSLKES